MRGLRGRCGQPSPSSPQAWFPLLAPTPGQLRTLASGTTAPGSGARPGRRRRKQRLRPDQREAMSTAGTRLSGFWRAAGATPPRASPPCRALSSGTRRGAPRAPRQPATAKRRSLAVLSLCDGVAAVPYVAKKWTGEESKRTQLYKLARKDRRPKIQLLKQSGSNVHVDLTVLASEVEGALSSVMPSPGMPAPPWPRAPPSAWSPSLAPPNATSAPRPSRRSTKP